MDMTNKEYIDKKGNVCPFCHSNGGVEGITRVETDDCGASQPVRCVTCGRKWTDLYVLIGYRKDD